MLSTVSLPDTSLTVEIEEIVNRGSLHDAAAQEALRFKWIESEREGFDLGASAIRHWVRQFWGPFVRDRWIEHLEGRAFWIELDHNDFGLLQRGFDDSSLGDEVIRRIKGGGENLDILCWSLQGRLSREEVWRVLGILETLDINSHRVECKILNDLFLAG